MKIRKWRKISDSKQNSDKCVKVFFCAYGSVKVPIQSESKFTVSISKIKKRKKPGNEWRFLP